MGFSIDRITRLTSRWLEALKRTPLVSKVDPVHKTGLSTGDPTEEQTRFSASVRSEAGPLYDAKGKIQGGPSGDGGQKLDGGP